MADDTLRFRALTGADFTDARRVADEWFGHPVGLTMHRLFFDQLGQWGIRVERRALPGVMAGVLLGVRSGPEPDLAYVHFHMVDPGLRGRGVGRALYAEFGRRMHDAGCRRIRALAAPGRSGAVAFHEALGFQGRLEPEYLGPGQDRIVFERRLPL